MLALVAIMRGNRMAQFGGHDAHQGRFIGRRDHQHGFLQAFGAQRFFHEFAHFAAPFADQADDDDIGHRLARDQAQQHALAHAGTGHQAHALSLAQGQHAVNRPHAHVQRFDDGLFLQGIDFRRRDFQNVFATEAAQVIDRLAQSIDHAAQPRRADLQAGLIGQGQHAGARGQARGFLEGHQVGQFFAETDDLRIEPLAAHSFNLTTLARVQAAAGAFQQQAGRADQAAGGRRDRNVADLEAAQRVGDHAGAPWSACSAASARWLLTCSMQADRRW